MREPTATCEVLNFLVLLAQKISTTADTVFYELSAGVPDQVWHSRTHSRASEGAPFDDDLPVSKAGFKFLIPCTFFLR